MNHPFAIVLLAAALLVHCYHVLVRSLSKEKDKRRRKNKKVRKSSEPCHVCSFFFFNNTRWRAGALTNEKLVRPGSYWICLAKIGEIKWEVVRRWAIWSQTKNLQHAFKWCSETKSEVCGAWRRARALIGFALRFLFRSYASVALSNKREVLFVFITLAAIPAPLLDPNC